MSEDFVIKQGDTLPLLRVTLRDEDGDPVDLSGASAVNLRLKRVGDTEATFTSAGAVLQTGTSPNFTDEGVVQYEWADGDTDVIGDYEGTFLVTFATATQSFPGEGNLLVRIEPNSIADDEDPTFSLVFATVAQARSVLHKDIAVESLSLAQTQIEMETGLLALTTVTDPVTAGAVNTQYDDLIDSDKYWLRLATLYQAAWIESQVDMFSRESVVSASVDGESKQYSRNALTLAPYAQLALSKMSGEGIGSIDTPRWEYPGDPGSVLWRSPPAQLQSMTWRDWHNENLGWEEA